MKSNKPAMRFQRGAIAPKLILIVIALAILAGAVWWFTMRSETSTVGAPGAPAAPGAPLPAAEVAPTIAPEVVELSVDQLYREARKALAEQSMVMPAGNNALEYYLAILEKEPANSGAQEALRELFPFASGTAEQEINLGNLDEATRIVAQLAKADPSNYTLTILRSKLDAKRKLMERDVAAQEAAAAATAAAAAARQATPTPATTPEAPVATAPAPAPAAAATTTPTPPAPTPAPVVAAPPTAPAPASGESRDVAVLNAASPGYPPQAARNRTEGWVEVEFTVNADGQVSNARVVGSDPPRVFDREAVRSIERTTFRPRMENGTPVNATVRRRIEFKLDG